MNSFDGKDEFSAANCLQSSVSFVPSEIILIYWFCAQESFLWYIFRKYKQTKYKPCIYRKFKYFVALYMFVMYIYASLQYI